MSIVKSKWIPPVLWGMIIIILSLLPGGQGQLFHFQIPHIDKVAHFGMYAVWAFLIYRALAHGLSVSGLKLAALLFIVTTITGIALEYSQYAVTEGRSFEMADMIANGAGALMGVT